MKCSANSIWGKALTVFLVVVFIVAAAETAFGDIENGTANYFDSLIEGFPFSKIIQDVLSSKLGTTSLSASVPQSFTDVLKDLVKLAFMALIQAPVVAVLERLFLPIPAYYRSSWEAQEDYMSSPGYRIKSLVITVLSTPLLAIIAAMIVNWAAGKTLTLLGPTGSTLAGVFGLIAVVCVSCLPLMAAAGLGFLAALLWRVVDVLVGRMLSAFLAEAGFIGMYLALRNGNLEIFIMIGFVLLIVLAGVELMFNAVRGVISPKPY